MNTPQQCILHGENGNIRESSSSRAVRTKGPQKLKVGRLKSCLANRSLGSPAVSFPILQGPERPHRPHSHHKGLTKAISTTLTESFASSSPNMDGHSYHLCIDLRGFAPDGSWHAVPGRCCSDEDISENSPAQSSENHSDQANPSN